jgi:phage/plasmid-associated DNA primase
MKEITGDRRLNARTHYGTKCEVNLLLTLILEANGIPDMDEVNEAVERRIRIIDFESKFCDNAEEIEAYKAQGRKNVFLKNSYFITSEFQNEYRCAFIQLLMNSFIGFHTNKNALMPMPDKVKQASSNYLKSSDPYYEWFVGNYEKTDKSIIYEADVYSHFKSSHYYTLLPKATQRDLKKETFVQKLKSNLFLGKMLNPKLRKESVDLGGENLTQISKDGFYGWALKPLEEENVIEEEQKE